VSRCKPHRRSAIGAIKLGGRGMCGEKRWGSPHFIGVEGSAVEVGTRGNSWLNGLQAIDGRGWLKRALIRGFKARES
jgi:hypothetical protein